jgi:hypothetical protein
MVATLYALSLFLSMIAKFAQFLIGTLKGTHVSIDIFKMFMLLCTFTVQCTQLSIDKKNHGMHFRVSAKALRLYGGDYIICLLMHYTYMSFKGCVLWTFVHCGMVQKWLESSLEDFMFAIEIKQMWVFRDYFNHFFVEAQKSIQLWSHNLPIMVATQGHHKSRSTLCRTRHGVGYDIYGYTTNKLPI